MSPGPVTDEFLDRLAAGVNLPLDPAHRTGVAEALARLLAVGALVDAGSAAGADEPAPVFDP